MTNSIYQRPDWQYVSRRLNELRWEQQGLHTKIAEIEALRYYERDTNLPPGEQKVGFQVRSGLTDELLENIKAAVLAGMPSIHIKGLRKKQGVEGNNSKREEFWQKYLESLLYPVNIISELADAQLLGLGVLKAGMSASKWNAQQLKKKRGEDSAEYIDRNTALKKLYGPPIATIDVHPLALYCRPGEGNKIDEVIEHSYKAKRTVVKAYGLHDTQTFSNMEQASMMPGQPDEFIRPLPTGMDTSNYFLVTEYWNPDCYQVYVNQQLVYENPVGESPKVCYFMAPGRSSSSKDPDKYGLSVAENLRHNEPIIDRQLTRMAEAAELIINKRNTLEVPEGYIPETDATESGDTKPRTWTFTDEYAETLPPGAKIVDPFSGAENVYAAMPFIQLLFQITTQHGPSPLLKGISPGAAGSGYRDNSLYLMAKQQFEYIIASLQECITQLIVWLEWLLVTHIKQEIWIGEYSLQPSDITDWPAEISVELKPSLPQNLLAEGQFWESQRQAGNVSRRYVREHGLNIEQPDEMETEVDLEQLMEQIKPYLMMDAMATVINKGPMANSQQGSGLVGPDGQTPISSTSAPPGGASGLAPNNSTTTNGRAGQQQAGYATGGQPKAPVTQPGVGGENR